MINNRQAGRRRGRGNNNGGGSPRQGGNPGRPDTGNRIDSRARGNANQLFEKYKNLARDAQMQGDRVNTEYYLQFADHYFRVLSETRARFEENNPQQQRQPVRTEAFSIDDDDYADEGEPIRAGEQQGDLGGNGGQQQQGQRYDRDDRPQQRDYQARDDRPRDDRPRDDRPREDRQRAQRDTRPRDQDGNRQDGNRQDAVRQDGARPDGNRQDGNRQDGARANGRGYAAEAPVAPANDVRAETPAFVPEIAEPVQAEEQPRRRGRPRRDRSLEEGAPVAAAAPVAEPAFEPAFDADRLPPSLSLSATATADAPEEKPRRRRVRVVTPDGEAQVS